MRRYPMVSPDDSPYEGFQITHFPTPWYGGRPPSPTPANLSPLTIVTDGVVYNRSTEEGGRPHGGGNDLFARAHKATTPQRSLGQKRRKLHQLPRPTRLTSKILGCSGARATRTDSLDGTRPGMPHATAARSIRCNWQYQLVKAPGVYREAYWGYYPTMRRRSLTKARRPRSGYTRRGGLFYLRDSKSRPSRERLYTD